MCSNTPVAFLVDEVQQWYGITSHVLECRTDKLLFCATVFPVLIVVICTVVSPKVAPRWGEHWRQLEEEKVGSPWDGH
jgi:hypothetical protein